VYGCLTNNLVHVCMQRPTNTDAAPDITRRPPAPNPPTWAPNPPRAIIGERLTNGAPATPNFALPCNQYNTTIMILLQ